MSRVHRVFLGSVAIPLFSLRLGTVLTHEAVTPAEVTKGVVGVRVVAQVAGDDDLFFVSAHVFIIGAGVKYARGNLEKADRRKCLLHKDLGAARPPPAKMALWSACLPISLSSSYTERINK
jgi:hypothetical protein